MNRLLKDWSFTQVGGGEGTLDGEWLQTSDFPTTVHVELLKLKKIPDPVESVRDRMIGVSDGPLNSSLVCMSGMYNVRRLQNEAI